MKRYWALPALILIAGALLSAQDTAGRVVVPARNSSRPRVLNASSTNGSITVKAYSGRDVIVETPGAERMNRGRTDRSLDGMHRIDVPSRGLVVEEEDNVITVRTAMPGPQNLVISVPADTSLHLRSTQGAVQAEGVHGEVDASSTNGSVALTNISGTVVANTTNGSVRVTMDRVDPGKPISFSSVNGSIDVALPADTKANLKLRAVHGSVWSDFEMKLTGGQPVTRGGGDLPVRIDFDRTIYGAINGGGTEASFYTVNGRITIRKK